jgi:hypothetical protein
VTRVDYYIFSSALAPPLLQQQHQCGTAGAEKANVLFILVARCGGRRFWV